VADEVAGLAGECMLSRSGDLEAYLAPAIEIPKVLHELGRLRELTFRAAGEGTGRHSISMSLTTTTFTCSSGMHESRKWLEPIAWRARTLCAETSVCAACTQRPSFATAIRFSIAWVRLSNSDVRSCGKSINGDSRLFCSCGRASAPSLRATLNTRRYSVPSASATSTRQSHASSWFLSWRNTQCCAMDQPGSQSQRFGGPASHGCQPSCVPRCRLRRGGPRCRGRRYRTEAGRHSRAATPVPAARREVARLQSRSQVCECPRRPDPRRFDKTEPKLSIAIWAPARRPHFSTFREDKMQHARSFVWMSWALRLIVAVILVQTLFFKFTRRKSPSTSFPPWAWGLGAASAPGFLNSSRPSYC
jgi:hypothetical protein